MSPKFAADVSLLLSATADPVVQDLLDANNLVRDMRRSSAQSLHFHSFNETLWKQLVFASWADASDRPRPDGSRTGGYVITLATEELFGHGQEDDVSVVSWRSFKLPRKLLDQTMVRLKLLQLLTNPTGWSVWTGLRFTVLRCGAGIWTKQSDKWAVCSSPILEVFLMPWREANHQSFDCEALEQMKRHVVSKNSVPFPMLAFTGSILQRCWQTIWLKLDILLVPWWSRSWSRNVGDAPLILPSSLADARKQEVLLSIKMVWTRLSHQQI